MTEVKKAVCLPLSRRVDVGLVSPAAWETYDLCRRQFSWYRQSPRAGQTLVVSSLPLPDIAPAPDVVIRNGSFRPPRLPTPEEQRALMQRASYREARPEEWENIGAVDREEQARWLNEPAYQVLEEGLPVPYSLGKTRTVCSACLEFYNIIGSVFPKKYVVPCPGAVLFAGMVPNHYYEVVGT
ncbi:MAG: hypothetical protein MUF69_03395 [Desulfobacterota bacterium]|nr:hypothetical protein [Thermodesulfobacteriota bacterium]